MGNRAGLAMMREQLKTHSQSQQKQNINSSTTPIQAKLCGILDTEDSGVLQSWKVSDNVSVQLMEGKKDEENNIVWVLLLKHNGVNKGTISIFYNEGLKTVKPDNLEVPEDKGNGYGAVLAKYAVTAMQNQEIQKASQAAEVIKLDLMNPISAHISIKELVMNLNGEDTQDGAAVGFATQAVQAFNDGNKKSKGYDVSKFAGFWGRLVYLAKHNNAVFKHILGTFNSETDFTAELAIGMLNSCASANIKNIKGFGLTVQVPFKKKDTAL
jgi:hypothetical protein